jgi:hypothetical protein
VISKPHTYWQLFFLLCISLLFLNLEYLPVVWLDEVMDLEPVGRWFLNGEHASVAWPMQGCEEKCLVNLPLRELPHFIALSLFGSSVWGLRCIFLLFYVAAAFGFWKSLNTLNLPKSMAYFFVAILFLDKGTLEMMRGCRPEIIEMAAMAWGFYFIQQKKWLIASMLFLALAWIHPSMWLVSFGFWLFIFIHSSKKIKSLSLISVVVSFLAFWLYIGGDYLLFFKQFSKSAGAHVPEYGFFKKLLNHFYRRYIAYWNVEFWWFFVFICSHIWIFSKWKQISSLAKITVLITVLTSVFWLLVLMPNHRYSVSLNMLLVFNLLLVLPNFSLKLNYKWVQFVVMAALLIPFGMRVALGLIHREERNPHQVIAWMEEQLPTQNTLLLGESIGSYWSLKHKGTKFAHDTQPQNARFEEYDQVFFLSRDKDYPIFSQYPIKQNTTYFGWQLKGKTYAGICLYKIESQETFNAIVKEGMKVNYFYD